MLSFEVDLLAQTVAEIKDRGGRFTDERPRQGLEDWQVIDLHPEQFFGAQLQLVERAAPPEG